MGWQISEDSECLDVEGKQTFHERLEEMKGSYDELKRDFIELKRK